MKFKKAFQQYNNILINILLFYFFTLFAGYGNYFSLFEQTFYRSLMLNNIIKVPRIVRKIIHLHQKSIIH